MSVLEPSNFLPLPVKHHQNGGESAISLSTSQFPLVGNRSLEVPHLVTESRREEYFKRIINHECPPLVVICGGSGVGKSTFVSRLEQFGLKQAERLMPRPRRPGDSGADRPWTIADTLTTSDALGPDKLFFSVKVFGGIYGYPSESTVRSWEEGQGLCFLLARVVDIPPLLEALENLFPLAPVVTVRLDSFEEVVRARLSRREEAYPGERDERLRKSGEIARMDRAQIGQLSQVYDVRTFLSVSGEELEAFGYSNSQIKPFSMEMGKELLDNAFSEAQRKAGANAQEVMRPYRFEADSLPSRQLISLLKDHLLLAARELDVVPCITGDFATSLYCAKTVSTVDKLEFTLMSSPDAEVKLKTLLERVRLTLPEEENATLIGRVANEMRDPSSGFCFTFRLDENDFFLRRTLFLPDQSSSGIIPPESLLLQKLVAGGKSEFRGPTLVDAAELMGRHFIAPQLIQKYIQSQLFDRHLEDEALLSSALKADRLNVNEALRIAGISHAQVVQAAQSITDTIFHPESRSLPSEGRFLSYHELKRMAMVAAVLSSLDNILEEAGSPRSGQTERVASASLIDKKAVIQCIKKLRLQLSQYLENGIGMHDTFVKGPIDSQELKVRYFKGLAEQRSTLAGKL